MYATVSRLNSDGVECLHYFSQRYKSVAKLRQHYLSRLPVGKYVVHVTWPGVEGERIYTVEIEPGTHNFRMEERTQ